jgi:SOS-response transcriptional repressor LexA
MATRYLGLLPTQQPVTGPRPIALDPTTRQKIVLQAIKDLSPWEGRGPTYREIAASLDMRSVRTIAKHIYALKRKGLVDFIVQEARSLTITERGKIILRLWERDPESVGTRVKVGQ